MELYNFKDEKGDRVAWREKLSTIVLCEV